MKAIRFVAMYYFKHLQCDSKTRYTCIGQSGAFKPLEDIKAGDKNGILWLYYTGQNKDFSDKAKARGQKTLTASIIGRDGKRQSKSISTLTFGEPSILNACFGDFVNTENAILVHFNDMGDEFKVYIVDGCKDIQRDVFNMWIGGQLNTIQAPLKMPKCLHFEWIDYAQNKCAREYRNK